MAQVVSRECPNCHAMLPPAGEADSVKCQYCGNEFDLKRTMAQPAAAPPTPSPVGPAFGRAVHVYPPMPDPAVRVVRATGCLTSAFVVIILAVVGAMVGGGLFMAGGSGGSVFPFVGSALGGTKMTWDETIGFYQVGGDGFEDLILKVRQVLQGDQFFVVALDGRDMSELWRLGPFGNYSQAYQYTHAVVVGNRLLVTDFRGQAHLYELATGREIAAVPLPDRAKRICSSASMGTQVFVQADNGQNASIDTGTGALSAGAAAPAGAEECPPPADLSSVDVGRRAFEGQVPGFVADTVLSEGGMSVVVGRRGAGVRVPMALGLAADGRTPTWQTTLPTVDEATFVEDSSHPVQFALRGGRLFGTYSIEASGPLGAGGRLVAIDARTGARLWESEVPSCCAHGADIDAIRVGPNRVLLEQFGEADVFDAASGQRLARISPW